MIFNTAPDQEENCHTNLPIKQTSVGNLPNQDFLGWRLNCDRHSTLTEEKASDVIGFSSQILQLMKKIMRQERKKKKKKKKKNQGQ